LCNNCVTFGEWREDLVNYYKNCNGLKECVQWDFTVGEETKELFSGKKP
jgi:hypothetical protein